jgi:hypothetical protein
MERWEDDNPQNLYVIRRKLSTYKMLPGGTNWEFRIGCFFLVVNLISDDYWKITNQGNSPERLSNIRITDQEKFHVDLYEDFNHSSSRNFLYINKDFRFKDHQPIQYNVIQTPTGGQINQSDGRNMPLLQLTELIRLLHRLSNLAVFA